MNFHINLIGLEGNAGCGKTTHGQLLSEKLGGVFLREYTETMTVQQRQFLKLNFERQEGDDEFSIWAGAEHTRVRQSSTHLCTSVIFDTSLLSVIAFGLAQQALGLGGNVLSLAERYIGLIERREIVLPSRVILLQISEPTRQARLFERGECHPFLLRSDVASLLTEIRMDFFAKYLPVGSWAVVNTTDLSVEKASEIVYAQAIALTPSDLNGSFSTWLTDLRYEEYQL